MINEAIFSVATLSILTFNTYLGIPPDLSSVQAPTIKEQVLATHEISLEKRYNNQNVNGVFKDNILLTMAYLRGEKIDPNNIDWNVIEKPFSYSFIIKPDKTFAFHNDVLPEFQEKVIKTTNAHFNSQDGFKSDGYLTGDGVCHLASLINWAATDAKLSVVAPTNHNFAVIPEIPEKYGTSIYMMPNDSSENAKQNLYITNNFDKPIIFVFYYDENILKLSVAIIEPSY